MRTRRFGRKTKAENRKSNVVVNLSSKPLNSAESSLLSRGLNFCPNPPKINVRELDEDLDQFARRLRIKEYFHSKKETSEDLSTDESDIKEVIDIPRFVKKSNWISKPSKNTRLESVIDLIKSDIKHNVDVHVPKTDNLTQSEITALSDIQERDDIIIKPADKGSAVVVMDKTTYILYLQEAERQLSDCRFYEKLDSDSTLHVAQKITRALEVCIPVVTQTIRPWSTLLLRIPSQAVSICCLKFTRKTIRGDRLCQPMVTQLKRYRNVLIFTFCRSLKTFHHTQRYYRLLDENGIFNHSRKYHACYHGCNFPLHEHSP